MSQTSTKESFSRRKFLKRGAIVLGGSVVASYLACSPTRRFVATKVESMDLPAMISSFKPDFWFEILSDNSVVLNSPKIEMGQGVWTGFAMIAAEELEIPYEMISVRNASTASGLFDKLNTGGSSSTTSLYGPIREVAATMRELLKSAAATKWNVAPTSVTIEKGFLIAGNNKVAFSEIAQTNKNWELSEKPKLKSKKEFKIIGTNVKRVDLQAKVLGKAKYTLDSDLPDMLYAVRIRSPFLDGTIKSLDTKEAENSSGVVKVVREGELLAVIAKSYYAADIAANKVKVEWNRPNRVQQSDLLKMVTVGNGKEVNVQKEGKASSLLEKNSDKLFKQEYRTPMATHAQMEVCASIADVKPSKVLMIVGSQGPEPIRAEVAKALDIDKDLIEIQTPLLGGGFGRKALGVNAAEAAILSKAVGKPVKLFNTRRQEFQNGVYRPNTHHRLEAVMDETQSKMLAIRHQQATPDMFIKNMMGGNDIGLKLLGADFISAGHGAGIMYDVPNKSVSVWNTEVPVPISIWRAVGMFPNTFAIESFISEVAHHYKQDALDFRINMFTDSNSISQRSKKVLEVLKEKSNWANPKLPNIGRGVAIGNDRKTIAAAAIEAEIVDNQIKIRKVTHVMDVGQVINPEGIKAQVEGCIMMGISAALYEEITVKDGQIENAYFSQYPLATLADVPEIECILLEGDEMPYGVGEPPLAPIAPAIFGAILDLTGKAHRELPIRLA